MDARNDEASKGRRDFLKLAAVAPAAVAGVAATGASAAQAPAADATAGGYRESEHVAAYLDSARF